MAEPTPKRIWDAALGQLQIHVTKPNYDTWLKETVGLELAADRFIVGAPTEFVKEWLSTRMRSLVSQALDNVIGRPTEVSFQIIGPENGDGRNGNGHILPPTVASAPVPGSTPSPQRSNSTFSFGNFVVGPSNNLAAAAALGAADNPGKDYNPLFIYSAPGLGKTHLLQAIASRAESKNHNALYVTSERFTNEFVTAIAQSRSDEFRRRYRSLQLLLIDDMQFLAGKERTQEEFFYTFNDLHASGCQVVLTNDRPPAAISGIESRLCSRFQWGLIADIQTPDLETRLAILQAKALAQNVELRPEVSNFLALRARHNIRELEGSLNRVLAYSRLINTSPISLAVATRALAALTPTRTSTPDPDRILRAVSSHFGITLPTLTSRVRTQSVADARHIAMYLLREDAHLALKQIGLLLGHRDHATVIHGVNKVTHALNGDPLLTSQLTSIRAAVSA